MLRVGLTGGLGSGKSTAARMFAAHGAVLLSSDEMGRELMQPGQAVYAEIVAWFGSGVVGAGGELDRAALARMAFGAPGEGVSRIDELNAIVHPAVIARQAEMAEEIARRDADAVVMVESALVFETKYGEPRYGETRHGEPRYGEPRYGETKYGEGGGWRRFDRIVLVRAKDEVKVARFVARAAQGRTLSEEERAGLEAEAQRRMAQQMDDDAKAALSDYVLTNDGAVEELQAQVDGLWVVLKADAMQQAAPQTFPQGLQRVLKKATDLNRHD
jgi:dephospho-CoA kinase